MDRDICPLATLKERTARHQKLMALRQQGTEAGVFAQTFWTLAVGLNYNESALKDLFNVCLDDPLPQWEMEGLRILDFWGFVRYLHHRSQWATPDHSEPLRRDFPTSPGPLTPTEKRRMRRKRNTNSTLSAPEPLLSQLRSGSSKSPLLSQLRSGSSKSPLLSQLRSRSSKSPLPSPLRSGSSKSPLPSPLRSGSSKSPLLSPLRSGSSKSPLLSQLRSGSSKSPLLSPLRSGSSKSPLLSPLRSGSSKSPLLSPLRSGSSKSPLLSPLRSGSSKSPLLSPLRSRSSKSPLLSPLRSGSSKSPLLSQLRSGSSKSPLLSPLRSGSSKSPLLSPWRNTGSQHGSSRENSALWSDYRDGTLGSTVERTSSGSKCRSNVILINTKGRHCPKTELKQSIQAGRVAGVWCLNRPSRWATAVCVSTCTGVWI